jgi:hypothetical protein
MRNRWQRALLGFVWGLALFLAIAWPLKPLLRATGLDSAFFAQVALKTALVLVGLVAWKTLGGSFSEMGFRRTQRWSRSYLRKLVEAQPVAS